VDFDFRHKHRVRVIELAPDVARVVNGDPAVDAFAIAASLDNAATAMRELANEPVIAGEESADGDREPDGAMQSDDWPKSPTDDAYAIFGGLTAALAHLVRWVRAARTAEQDADRHRRAAVIAAADAGRLLDGVPADELLPLTVERLRSAIAAISQVQELHDVQRVQEALVATPLPMPWEDRERNGIRVPRAHRRQRPGNMEGNDDARPEPAPRPAAFLTFWLNEELLATPHHIHPDVIYDLHVQVQFSRWPRELEVLLLVPLHVELAGTLDVPTFRFDIRDVPRNSAGEPRYDERITLEGHGRVRVHAPLDLFARPMQVRYVGEAEIATSGDPWVGRRRRPSAMDIDVHGQHTIELRSYDLAQNPISGFRSVDERILQLRDTARREGLSAEELTHFTTLLAAAGRIAAEAVADNLYPGVLSEAEFQRDVRTRLRATPRIGSALEEHPRAAGGITDLSFHKIRLELKTQDDAPAAIQEAVARYGEQTAQYVAGSDRRTGVLMVLDTTAKSAAPRDVGNDIDIAIVSGPGDQGRSIVLGVVLVQGDLARPSDLSR